MMTMKNRTGLIFDWDTAKARKASWRVETIPYIRCLEGLLE